MKNILYVAFLFATNLLLAQDQNDKKIFLDSLWNESTEGNHIYYRIIKDYHLEKDTYTVFDYYKSGVLQMSGSFSDKKATLKKGTFTYYYENGNKKQEYIPKEKGDSISKSIFYYENGNVKSETITNELTRSGKTNIYYSNGNKREIQDFDFKRTPQKSFIKILNFWDNQNRRLIVNGNGNYLLDTTEEKISGTVQNGDKIGKWIDINKKTQTTLIENFDNTGKFLEGERIEKDGTKTSYSEIETKPKPHKGIPHFTNYLVENLKRVNFNKIVIGKVFIEFVVEKDGSLVEAKIQRSIAAELDQKIIHVLSKYENWIPGQQKGIPVRVRYSLPLNFNLK